MEIIRPFSKLDKKSVAIAGGKGASLGEMTRAWLPVPPGFVVLAGAFDRFVRETEIDADIEAIIKKVNHKDINSIDKASVKIRDLIMEEKVPKDIQKEISEEYNKLAKADKYPYAKATGHRSAHYKSFLVAVRSSATAEDSSVASWAGELETYLNVMEKNLIESIKKCWSSLFTPRAIFYAFEKGFYKSANKKSRQHTLSASTFAKATVDRSAAIGISPIKGENNNMLRTMQKVSVAVVVQKMVQSEVSGICFTAHPVTKDYNQMVIEAGFGLGEAIVGGMVTPDTYVIHKDNFSILDINVSEQSFAIVKTSKGNIRKKLSKAAGGKQKLAGRQIVELAKICKSIEQHYGCPQDIEWAMEKGKFYITQSRPITTL
ncbi:MAG: hypothetical protein M1383_04065 [Patescibacteria group bacterium]|nr:hypothetical protein [Patescibacteria group bacterium]